MTTTKTKRLTFEEWQALPETKQKCEVVDGVLIMAPSPTDPHQLIAGEIFLRLAPFVKERDLGVVLQTPRDVLITREPLRVRQPDLLFLSAARSGVRRPSDLVGPSRIDAPIDLVVEVLSPSNTRRDIEERLADYESIGVPEAWIASFTARNIRVLRLAPDGWNEAAIYGMGDTLRSEVLPGFELAVGDVFGPLLT